VTVEGPYPELLNEFVQALSDLRIQRRCVLFLHVRLRAIKENTGLDYRDCTRLILDGLDTLDPKAVLVPAFTYTFVKSGVFHRQFSRAETGRFSEEVRNRFARYRTADPIFSVLDTRNWLIQQENLNTTGAFEPGCLWERLLEENCVIINIGIDTFVATQVHYLERLMDVPYRNHVIKRGVVYEDDVTRSTVEYDFFARNLEQNLLLDWPLIKTALSIQGCLQQSTAYGVQLQLVRASDIHHVLLPEMTVNPYAFMRRVDTAPTKHRASIND